MAGWAYDDWAGIVYPHNPPRDFDALAHLAQYVDCLEVNSSFYRPPSAQTCASWVGRTASLPDFLFTVKLWQRFTHSREPEDFATDQERCRQGIAPLVDAHRLGALLVQFPWSFKRTRPNAEWLKRVCDAFADLRPAVELRHASWNEPGVLNWLDSRNVSICAIDQPQFADSMGPLPLRTGHRGYVRLHGRNHENWFREDAQTFERYDYLYREDELDPWIARIREIAEHSDETFVITNNHYRGQAVVNALEIRAALTGGPVPAPESLRRAYGVLGPKTYPSGPPLGEPAGDLFA